MSTLMAYSHPADPAVGWAAVQRTLSLTHTHTRMSLSHTLAFPLSGVPPEEDFRFYSRGLFASPLLTHLNPAAGWAAAPFAWPPYVTLALAHALADYPLRHFSNHRWVEGRVALTVSYFIFCIPPPPYTHHFSTHAWDACSGWQLDWHLSLACLSGLPTGRHANCQSLK